MKRKRIADFHCYNCDHKWEATEDEYLETDSTVMYDIFMRCPNCGTLNNGKQRDIHNE